MSEFITGSAIWLLCAKISCGNIFMGLLDKGPYRCPVCKNDNEILLLSKSLADGSLIPVPFQKDGKVS